jgi:hypothetical protein
VLRPAARHGSACQCRSGSTNLPIMLDTPVTYGVISLMSSLYVRAVPPMAAGALRVDGEDVVMNLPVGGRARTAKAHEPVNVGAFAGPAAVVAARRSPGARSVGDADPAAARRSGRFGAAEAWHASSACGIAPPGRSSRQARQDSADHTARIKQNSRLTPVVCRAPGMERASATLNRLGCVGQIGVRTIAGSVRH